jgi:hypothetical protein
LTRPAATAVAAISGESLLELVDYARQLHVRIALAGSLDAAAIEELLPFARIYRSARRGIAGAGTARSKFRVSSPSRGRSRPAAIGAG